jgi:hypothetical protein
MADSKLRLQAQRIALFRLHQASHNEESPGWIEAAFIIHQGNGSCSICVLYARAAFAARLRNQRGLGGRLCLGGLSVADNNPEEVNKDQRIHRQKAAADPGMPVEDLKDLPRQE